MPCNLISPISGSECIGDSRIKINNNFNVLCTSISNLSSLRLDNQPGGTSTIQNSIFVVNGSRILYSDVRSNSISAVHLANSAITTDKIALSAITTDKIAPGAIGSTQLSAQAVTTQTIANSAVTGEKMSGNQSGNAPVYGIRAWVNFNGMGGIGADQTIRAQGNVSRVVKLAAGDYRIEFTTPMLDTNYCVFGAGTEADGTDTGPTHQTAVSIARVPDMLTTSVRVLNANLDGNQNVDGAVITVSVIR